MVFRVWGVLCVTVGVMFVFPGCAAADPLPINPDPVGFPDIAGYTAADLADYQIMWEQPGPFSPRPHTFFMTPDGLECSPMSDGRFACSGKLPGMPPRLRDVPAWIVTGGTGLHTDASAITDGTNHGQRIRTLPPFHSLTAGGSVCVVDNAGTTACKDAQGGVTIFTPKGTRSLRAGEKTWTYFLK